MQTILYFAFINFSCRNCQRIRQQHAELSVTFFLFLNKDVYMNKKSSTNSRLKIRLNLVKSTLERMSPHSVFTIYVLRRWMRPN